jgi:hypothetical protein
MKFIEPNQVNDLDLIFFSTSLKMMVLPQHFFFNIRKKINTACGVALAIYLVLTILTLTAITFSN